MKYAWAYLAASKCEIGHIFEKKSTINEVNIDSTAAVVFKEIRMSFAYQSFLFHEPVFLG